MSSYETVVNKLLEKTLNLADKTGEFLSEQIPDVVEQLLVWHFTHSLIVFLIGVIVAIYSLKRIFKVIDSKPGSRYKQDNGDCTGYGVFVSSMSSVTFVMFSVVAINTLDWLKIWVAPKLYLLEYATSLVK